MADFGIELIDLQLKRINYVEEVRKDVFARMIAERNRIAERYRSEGQGQAARIRGERERELQRIQCGSVQDRSGDGDRAGRREATRSTAKRTTGRFLTPS